MNKLIFTAILSGFAGLYAMGQNEIRLMDMDLNKSYQTYGGAVKGKSVTNEPASIQGKTYDDVRPTNVLAFFRVSKYIFVPSTKGITVRLLSV